MKFFITGDTHGEKARFSEIFNLFAKCEDKEKYICIAGDFGFLFHNDNEEHLFLDYIEKQDFTVIVIPGNHENYSEFQKYKTVDFHGAKAHRIRKNIFYIRRGEIFEFCGKSFFCMSGGNSIDRMMRIEGISWWREEMPTDEEYKYAFNNIKQHKEKGKKIDFIISHTAPISTVKELHGSHGHAEYPLNRFLEDVNECLEDEYTMHFFGHFHIDKEMPHIKKRALWFDYVELPLNKESDA